MASIERKLILSLVDLGMYDLPKATQFLEKFSCDYDNDFTTHPNRLAFKSVAAIIKSGSPPLSDLVRQQAIRFGANTQEAEYVKKDLDDDVEKSAGLSIGLEGFAKDVIEAGDKRRLLNSMTAVIQSVNDPKTTAKDCLKRLAKESLRSRDSRTHRSLTSYSDAILGPLKGGAVATKIVKTGITALDRVIGGWQPTLNLVGAEPGVGKSAIFATSLEAISRSGIKAALFSLEDEPSWLSYRILSNESGIDQFKMRFESLKGSDVDLVSSSHERTKTYQDNIIIVDGSDRPLSDDDVVATSNDLFYNHGVGIIFVDHLGELTSKVSDRHDLEISNQLSNIRRIANRLGIPVVVAAHFRRPAGGGRISNPTLTDFANSAGAERKARVALGLTREPGTDIMNIHILKQTNGPSGLTISVKFDGMAAMIINSENGGQH